MATIKVYNQATNTNYTVVFNLKNTQLVDVEPTGVEDWYLEVSTTMSQSDGTAFPHFVVRNLADLPPGYSTVATDLSNLCSKYVTYFIDTMELLVSSSSSSTSSSSSSWGYSSSSSSSSSEEYSSSSSSQSV